MSYDARVFNVMIASPSDVASERSIVREVIYDWNAVHSEEKSMVLLPVGWESHSSPGTGRPQEILNKQMVDKCDLLVGIFGTRIGTDTGKYSSGTVEEIEEHIALGKPAMLYFSKQLGDSEAFDRDQYARLEELKKDYENRALYETYDGDTDFKDKFSRHLSINVNTHAIFQFRDEEINSGLGREELGNNIPQLSDEAKALLKEVSQASQGYIFFNWEIPLMEIGDNGRSLIADNNPRTVAQWRAVLKELVDAELLDEADHRPVFPITLRGYEVADMIEVKT